MHTHNVGMRAVGLLASCKTNLDQYNGYSEIAQYAIYPSELSLASQPLN